LEEASKTSGYKFQLTIQIDCDIVQSTSINEEIEMSSVKDQPTPQVILDDPLFQQALEEYYKLPEVTTDTWYCEGIQHLVYWAQHEIDLVDEGERQGDDDVCEVTRVDYNKIKKFIAKWKDIRCEHEGKE
jgi:hypothetical protein